MGRIADRMKQNVIRKFEEQKDSTDVEQQIDSDGLGFTIKRANGNTLIYIGSVNKYLKI